MSSPFVFKGYIVSIIDKKRICVRIDPDDVDSVSAKLSKFYDKTVVKDTITVNVLDAKIAISIDWNEIQDLIGIHIKITATSRKYNYWKTVEINDDNNDRRYVNRQCKGVSIIAKKITNHID